jgi:endoglucanase
MRHFAWLAFSAIAATVSASEIVDVSPINDKTILVHFDDGYVQYAKGSQKRNEAIVHTNPLDTVAAMRSGSYSVESANDKSFVSGVTPSKVGRKSKGTEFAWYVDRWENNHAVNNRPDHTKEHWVYLTLPKAMKSGSTYKVSTGKLATNVTTKSFVFDASVRSESVHVNSLGYSPKSPAKYGYVYHWAGDLGGINFKSYEGKPFFLVDSKSGKSVFEGKVAFRKSFDNQETAQLSDSPPFGNFLKADVFECDFSAFNTPGQYQVYVPGIGSSFGFKLGNNALNDAFFHTARALYHNRSGIELKKPYTEFIRPAPHNTKLTPGFKGKLKYTSSRWLDWSNPDSSPADKAAMEAGMKGDLDVSGWYQDAGDWDSYESHLRVAQELLIAYQIAPENFKDNQLNIPESGNGIPDILDEAMWLPRFCYRLRAEIKKRGYGTGGIGLRVCGDQFGEDGDGTASYQDVNRTWIASGEDPVSTFRYAGAAAHIALVMRPNKLKDPDGIDWQKEAIESYQWAIKNTKPADEPKVKANRIYAAAGLAALTSEKTYEQQLSKDTLGITETTHIGNDDIYGPALYALNEGGKNTNPALLSRLKAAIVYTATKTGIETSSKRALRWAGLFEMPMLIGQQCNPMCLEVPLAYKILKTSDPAKSRQFLAIMYTTADYFMGTNSENRTWITGVGARPVTQIFHLDAWYRGSFQPGLIPYSPWRKEKDSGQGPWDVAWPYYTVYPTNIDVWPGNEQYFSNRNSPMASEFTVHQNIGPAAAFYGLLIGE